MKRNRVATIFSIALVSGLIGPLASADTPSADYIFPAGGQRGTTVEFRVGAHFLHGGSPFEMSGPGVAASDRIVRTKTTWFEGPMIFKPASQGGENYPKDHRGKVTIAKDAPLGPRYWRLWTSQGAVGGRMFVVGDLPEIIEREIDGRPLPVSVELPVTINGRMFPREDVDLWEFSAEAGQSITCEVVAARIGSPLDSHLEIRGPDGRTVTENTDHFGSDSFVRFEAPVTGRYRARIHDVSFRGLQQFVYRLTITADSYVDRVYPLGGRAGQKVAFELAGQKTPAELIELTLPSDKKGKHLVHFPLGDRVSNPVEIEISDADEFLETEAVKQTVHNSPAVLNGRIGEPKEVDQWLIGGKKDESVEFDLGAARLHSPLDPVLVITDAAGKELLRTGSTPEKPAEPTATFKFPADGQYTFSISDVFDDRGGDEFAYRLYLRDPEPRPDFQLRLPSDALTLYRGGEAKLKIAIQRIGGFNQEVELRADGLPDGVTAAAVKIAPGKKDAELVLKAEKTAPVRAVKLKVFGKSKIGDDDVERQADMTSLRDVAARNELLLAVSMPTPFTVDGVKFKTSYAARGTVHRRRYTLHRNGFAGPLTVLLADRQVRHQQGVTGPTISVAADANEFVYPINIPTWLEMNRTGRMVVMAVGEVADEQGVKHKVSFSSGTAKDQIIILTAPCPLNIRTTRGSLRAASGQPVEVGVKVNRGVLAAAPIQVVVLPPEHIKGVVAEPLTIPADQSEGVLKLRFQEPLGPFNMPVTIRATMISEGDPVLAETSLDLVAAD